MTFLLAGITDAAISQSGNRVWDQSKNMSSVSYTWNSYGFSGFYYDLDSNLSTERITINNIKRTIDRGDISYETSPIEVSFDYPAFGKYQVIGFMADKYFAGYISNSVISDNKKISTIANGQLLRVLVDDSDKRVISEGGTFTMKEGYVLKVNQIDIGGGPRQVLVTLLKDGSEVDTGIAAAGETYIYSKQVGGIGDLPIIAVRFDSVFRGTEVNAAFIKGVFQVSDSYTKVTAGDRYGIMEITAANSDRITMENTASVDLSSGNTVDLMGNLKIIVADNSSVLRFALSADRTGTYEVRGTIYPVTAEWTPLNFGLNVGGGTGFGFYYDIDKGIGTEFLSVEVSGSSIPAGSLSYSTSPQEIGFDYPAFGSYKVIGFMADRYFAGYSANSVISGNKDISPISNGQLQRVLLDDSEKRVVPEGGSLTLKEGYVIKFEQVDIGAGKGEVLISLLKDGSEVDKSIVAGGETYVYTKTIGSVSDLPIIALHFESVFRGTELNAAFTKGIFQISSSVTSVKAGDTYGEMEISSVGPAGIKMNNPGSIGLSRGSTMDIMGNIKFKTADSSDLRFYPYVEVKPEMMANQLAIDAPAKAAAGDAVRIKVTAGGDAVQGASVSLGPLTGLTDRNGTFSVILPKTYKGLYNITAALLGFEKANRSINVAAFVDKKLSIDAPSKANQLEEIAINITYNGTAVDGVDVFYDNNSIGTTDGKGSIKYSPQTGGTHVISASKSGFITALRDIDVMIPFIEFKSLNIQISPGSILTGQNIIVSSSITNAGTKTGTVPVVLVINSTEVANRSFTLAPREEKEINFTYKVDLPAGNYTVEILGQKGPLEVFPAKRTPFEGSVLVIGEILTVYLVMVKRRKKML